MTKKQTYYLIIIFFIGFTSLLYEIYSVKVLFLFFIENTKAATISISSFLAGLAFSSLYFSKLSKDNVSILKNISLLQIIAALYSYFLLKNYHLIPTVIDLIKILEPELLRTVIKFTFMWLFLFIPAFFIGGAFPLITSLFLDEKTNLPKTSLQNSIGTVYFWDTVGGILGALLTGFVFIPYLGLTLTCLIGVLINLILFALLEKNFKKTILTILFLIVISFNEYFSRIYQGNDSKINVQSELLLKQRFGSKILFQESSDFGLVTVGLDSHGVQGNKGLYINYRDMCHSKLNKSEKIIGNITASLIPKNSKVLNIGLGCGFTASQIAESQNVSELRICEINPIVVKANQNFFQDENKSILTNSKTKLLIQDGATFIRETKEQFQAIVIDIEEVSVIYSSPLYTSEYFEMIKDKMPNDGMLAIWSFYVSPVFSKVLINTLKKSFRYVDIEVLTGNILFFASNHNFTIPHLDQTNFNERNMILNFPNNEINTIDNKALEKHYSSNQTFNLPTDYSEEYVR
jgi:spermidine synthase